MALAASVESVTVSRQSGDKSGLAIALSNLGLSTLWVQHDPIQAQVYFDEGMALRARSWRYGVRGVWGYDRRPGGQSARRPGDGPPEV